MIKLIQGDCLEVMKTLDVNSVDAVITDPPYGITMTGLTKKTRAFDTLKEHDWESSHGWIAPVSDILVDGGAFYIFTCDDDISDIRRTVEKCGMRVNSRLVWIKTNPLPSFQKVAYRNSTEIALYGNKGNRVKYFAERTQQELVGYWFYPIVGGAKRTKHPTQKPLELISEWVTNSCPPGGIVFDPFMGSGTTCVACIQTGRNFIGIELDPNYFSIATNRIQSAIDAQSLPHQIEMSLP